MRRIAPLLLMLALVAAACAEGDVLYYLMVWTRYLIPIYTTKQ